jgi:hypothetical protein
MPSMDQNFRAASKGTVHIRPVDSWRRDALGRLASWSPVIVIPLFRRRWAPYVNASPRRSIPAQQKSPANGRAFLLG